MKLQQLASKPTLTKIVIDDEDIVKEYGEELEFYIYDRQPMSVFMKLASMDQNENSLEDLAHIVEDMIMDEQGKKIINKDVSLPIDVMVKVIEKTVNRLGNTKTPTSVE
jgi:hypothetical protein